MGGKAGSEDPIADPLRWVVWELHKVLTLYYSLAVFGNITL